MQNREIKLVCVLGRGTDLTEEMIKFLNKVVKFVVDNPASIIVTAGGYTDQVNAPQISEAGIMEGYLRERLESLDLNITIVPIDTTITVTQNLREIHRVQIEQGVDPARVVLFCDECKKPITRWLSLFVFHKLLKIETHDMTKDLVEKLKMRFLATPLQITAYWFPWFEKKELQRRESIIDGHKRILCIGAAALAAAISLFLVLGPRVAHAVSLISP